ncbi:inactive protein RESTRICTED TEV MOVEMENT 1-like [Macadamia integrifolia]|uniref:inactive protein RESTRICTED TEV MOVEMENT 1-like n=1 Tax=Macadamia integrifolia TaxID=60698 RepID=UPI001C501372|nr:inactive protein RESTRICTED TEV MOVEMENT 1-like [Macadamia integrifolia]
METMIKVGPYGGGEVYNTPWDEKGQRMVTQIFISYDSSWIKSIQTAYNTLDGKLQLSDKHGGDGEIFTTIDIDYPSEFITGISGYNWYWYKNELALKSLTIETNRRKFGPFGEQVGKSFCIQMGTNRCFAGFHGRSNSSFVHSIGVYIKPTSLLEDTTSSTHKIKLERK